MSRMHFIFGRSPSRLLTGLYAALASVILTTSTAGAQVQPIPEQQLANGFLRDQNARLTSQDAPSGDSYAARAAYAIEQNDYRRALAILRPYRRGHEPAYYFLSGRAHEGLGDYTSARRDLTEAIRRESSFIGAHLALGLMEAGHGDRAAAVKVLDFLKARQTQCAMKCRDATDLGVAVGAIEAAMRARSD